MTDHPEDTRIRALMVEMANAAPAPPSAADLGLDAEGLATYATPAPQTAQGRQRRPLRMLGAVAAMFGLVGGGGFAIASLTSDDGSNRPEAAVERLIDALADEDAIGVLESLASNERDVLVPAIRDAIPELERVGLLADVDLASVGGFDFDVVGLEMTSRYLTDDLAAVKITAGTLVSAVSPTEIPIGPAVGNLATGAGVDLSSELNEFARGVDGGSGALIGEMGRLDVEVLVVNDDGWHVSLQYTAAEAARKVADAAVPDFAAALTPVGADSPESAVETAMTAITAGDLATVIGLLDPVEVPVAYDYGTLVVETLANTAEQSSFTIAGMHTDGDGKVRRVTIDAYTATSTHDGYRSTDSWDGTCLTYAYGPVGEAEDGSDQTCTDDAEWASQYRTDPGYTWTVTERDGRWYLSPFRTTTDSALEVLRASGSVTSGDEGVALLFGVYRNPVFSMFLFGARGMSVAYDSSADSTTELFGEPEIPAVCVELAPNEDEWASLGQVRTDTLMVLMSTCGETMGFYGSGAGDQPCLDGIDVTSGVRPDEATLSALSECLLAEGMIRGEPPAVCEPFTVELGGEPNMAGFDRYERCLHGAGYYDGHDDGRGYLSELIGEPLSTECPQPITGEGENAVSLDTAWGAHVRCVLTSVQGEDLWQRLPNRLPGVAPEECADVLELTRSDEELGRAFGEYQDCALRLPGVAPE